MGGPPAEHYDETRGGQYDGTREGSIDADADADVDAEHEVDDLADAKPKKKRRVIKMSDKKYQCPQPNCGKAYSRAEHLYRHQLNRASCTARAHMRGTAVLTMQ